jgi:hypothetical protein
MFLTRISLSSIYATTLGELTRLLPMSLWLVLSGRTVWLILCGLVNQLGSTTFGQSVDFSNARPFVTPADRKVYGSDGLPLVGPNFVAQLYYGAAPNSLTPVTDNPAAFRPVSQNDPTAGMWLGGHRTLTGMTIGQVAILQVRAWDASGGLSLDEARLLGRDWGESAMFTYHIPGMGPDSAWFMEEFRSFTLVPEPSVIALALIGGAGLLFFKRRK